MPHRILVVDDEEDITQLIATRLKANGYAVDTAASAAEAVVQIDKAAPDLIIIDLMLPGKTGWQFVQDLRKQEAYAQLPVIMLSGLISAPGEKQSALDQGDYYLPKPFDRELLLMKIEELLSKKANE